MLRAFISSTFIDLKNHRHVVISALRKGRIHVHPMEEWQCENDEPRKFCLERVAECQVCVLLIARRRGFVPAGAARSITQMEYDYAREHHIDILPLFLDDDAAWDPNFDEINNPPSVEEGERMRAWRAEISARHGVNFFSADPQSLAEPLFATITGFLELRHQRDHIVTYHKGIEKTFGAMRILSVPNYSEHDIRNIPLGELYVEPALSPRLLQPHTADKDLSAAPTAQEVLLKHPRLAVLGEPGIGKSSLVSWIAWQLAVDALPDGRQTDLAHTLGRNIMGPIIPVPMILRDLEIDAVITWDRLLQAFLHKPLAHPLVPVHQAGALERILRDGLAFFLIDGIDEIASIKTRLALRAALIDGMARFPKCRWMFTSRPVGYREAPFHEIEKAAPAPAGDEVPDRSERIADLFHLVPFDDRRIEKFAHQWYIFREESPALIDHGIRELLKAIRKNRGTHNLARTPHLLTMIALVHKADATLPDGRAVLYNKIAEAYLHKIDDGRGLLPRGEDWLVKRAWLARIGFEMQLRRTKESADAIVVPKADLCGWLGEAMAPTTPSPPHVDETLDYLVKRSGLLVDPAEGHGAFVHLSFQEYFAACYIKDLIVCPDWQETDWSKNFGNYANDPLWQETLVFLVELVANSDVRRWVGTVLNILFGRDLNAIGPEDADQQNRVTLLARLATDAHAGLTPDYRARALDLCCTWETAAQKRMQKGLWEHKPRVVAALLAGTDNPQPAFARLIEKVRQAGLTKLNLTGTPLEDLKPLGQLAGLQELYLSNTLVTDLKPLGQLTELHTLALGNTPVTDLRPLGQLAGLQTLVLNHTAVTDLKPLGHLAGLEWLSLNNTAVTDLKPLGQLAGLHRLYLANTAVTDLKPLGQLAGLEWLSLNNTAVTDLKPLGQLAGLQSLSLSNTPVTDLKPLGQLAGLQSLYLSNTPVTDLKPLGQLAGLQELYLDNTPVTDLKPLGQLAGLQKLHLNNTPITDLTPLGRLLALQFLHLEETRVNDLKSLGQLAGLRTLYLDKTPVTDLTPLSQLARLQTLWLGGSKVSRQEVTNIRKALPKCEVYE